jgi:hypothetical protein
VRAALQEKKLAGLFFLDFFACGKVLLIFAGFFFFSRILLLNENSMDIQRHYTRKGIQGRR